MTEIKIKNENFVCTAQEYKELQNKLQSTLGLLEVFIKELCGENINEIIIDETAVFPPEILQSIGGNKSYSAYCNAITMHTENHKNAVIIISQKQIEKKENSSFIKKIFRSEN